MKLTQSLWLAAALLLAAAASPRADMGGELGNGRTKAFANDIIGVELEYPDTWKYIDLSSTVSFTDRSSELKISASDRVFEQASDRIRSSDDLLALLKDRYPSEKIAETQVDGRRAFSLENGDRGLLCVFRRPGRVTAIRYRPGESEASRRELLKTLRSIQLRDSAY